MPAILALPIAALIVLWIFGMLDYLTGGKL